MALRNAQPDAAQQPAAAAATKTTPAFEEMEKGDTENVGKTEASANDATTEAAKPAQEAKPSETRSVATQQDAGAAKKFAQEVEAMKGAADFSYGNYPIFKGISGELKGTGTTKATLGRWVKVAMLAWDDHFEISPGDDGEDSKESVAYSDDGVTIRNVVGEEFQNWVGKNAQDYVDFLKKQHDFDKASIRRFIDVGCVVMESDSNDDYNGEVIQVTLSQSSIPSFKQYQEKLVMKAKAVARGIPGVKVPEDPFTFYFLREAAEKAGKNWTKLQVVDKLPARI